MATRVLLVSAEYPPLTGGIGDYTALLAAHLAAEGATVSVMTSGIGASRQDGDVSVLPVVPKWNWGVAEAVRDAIRSTEPDIVHVQYQTGMYGMHPAINFLPDRLKRRYAGCVVTTFHDLRRPYLFPKAGPLRTYVTRHLARAGNVAIATNGADLQTLKKWHAKAALVPIGSNIPAASAADGAAIRARYRIAPDAILITTFGLINQSKGMETLVEALALLRHEGLNAHLLLVGAGAGINDSTNKATEAAIVARCDALEVTASVTWTDALAAEDVARILAASDVCLLPYRDGASPRRGSLLAALTQGVPVVTTTPAPGIYDGLPALQDGDAALFVPPGDARALADAVSRVMRDGALATRLCAGAAAYARHFTWPAIARQTLAVYAAIGATDTARRPVAAVAPGVER